jgi:sec-independent protein translocase protein TatC
MPNEPMSRRDTLSDPDDMFADTRMSFGDHLEDLRTHLLRAIYGFLVGLVISAFIGQPVLRLIAHPVEQALAEFYERRDKRIAESLQEGSNQAVQVNQPKEIQIQVKPSELARVLGLPNPPVADAEEGEEPWQALKIRVEPLNWAIAMGEAERMVNKPPMLATMNVMEGFMVLVKVCMVCALVIGSPWIFWQIWLFVAAGLYRHEKRLINVYLPISLVLFLGGVFMCEFFVIPKAVGALLWFNEWLGLQPELRLNEWLSFAILMPVVFGVAFQTPMVMLLLAQIGIFDVETFRKKRRIAWFIMAIAAAALAPIDWLSMLLLWAPMCVLYELGIVMAQFAAKRAARSDVPEPDDMVQV